MSNEDGNRSALVALVLSRSAAPSCSAATSLARRGMQDLLARAEAEEWYQRGLILWMGLEQPELAMPYQGEFYGPAAIENLAQRESNG